MKPTRDSVNNEYVIRLLMREPEGRRWLWNKISDCRVFSTTQQFGENAAIATAFLEGKRSVGLALLADINRLCPNEYGLAVKENGARDDNRSNKPARRADGADDASDDGSSGPGDDAD